jgi:hypothetical protein
VTPRRATLVAQAASLVLLTAGIFGLWFSIANAPDSGFEGRGWAVVFGSMGLVVLTALLVLGAVGLWRWSSRGFRKPLVYYDIVGVVIGFSLLRGAFEEPEAINPVVVLGLVFSAMTGIGLYLVDRYRRPAA